VIDVGARAATRRVAGAGGVGLAVYEAGEPTALAAPAPVVLLVHGYPDCAEMWQPVVARLADRFRVVSYDTRGAGASDAPPATRDYRLDRLVDDLAAVAGAVSPDRPVHLVGHDWGSVQGWSAVTADRLAGRIASFTSLSGPGLDHVGRWVRDRLSPASPDGAWRQLATQGLRSWYIGALHLPGARLFWTLGGGRWVTRALVRSGELPPDARPSATLARDGANGVRLYRANLRPGRRGGARTAPRVTTVPVQLVVATGDRWVTPALLDDAGRWAPDLVRREVAGGRHWLPRLQPDDVAAWIATHVLRNCGSSGGSATETAAISEEEGRWP
jgi:pimeloyl-ACP methyl ester carboxylesterase